MADRKKEAINRRLQDDATSVRNSVEQAASSLERPATPGTYQDSKLTETFVDSSYESENRSEKIVSQNTHVSDSLNTLLTQLMAANTRDYGLSVLRPVLKYLIEFLPGPISPQKLIGLDSQPSMITKFWDINYERILLKVVNDFTLIWPREESEVLFEKLFVVDGGGLMIFNDSLTVLTTLIKDAKPSTKLDVLVALLEKLVKSDALITAILEQCRSKENSDATTQSEKIIQSNSDQMWEVVMQMLVSLPNRVGNKLQERISDTFIPDNYCKILCIHMLNCIQIVSQGKQSGCSFNIQPLSLLMGKLFVNYNARRKSPGLLTLLRVLAHWSSAECYSHVIQDMFKNLKQCCIGTVAIMLLETCPDSLSIYNILGDSVITSQDWRYVFLTKIPLMHFSDWHDVTLLRNLMTYLSMLPDSTLMYGLLMKLLTVWCDKSALNHTPLQQHVYITQALILCTQHTNSSISDNDRSIAQKKLFSGIPTHLESTNESVRNIGMITAEILTNFLYSKEDGPKLNFEYCTIQEETSKIIENLRTLSTRCDGSSTNITVPDVGKQKPNEEFIGHQIVQKASVDYTGQEQACIVGDGSGKDMVSTTGCSADVSRGDDLLLKLMAECKLDASAETKEVLEVKKTAPQPKKNPLIEIIESGDYIDKTKYYEQMIPSDDELDSDDDLEPYDLSNDTVASKTHQPKYLRDLMQSLIESKEPYMFLSSMDISEELITTQLPNDDVNLAIELLEIFTCLNERFPVVDFDQKRFASSVAIVVVYPGPCAEYLCNQFHEEIGKHSISERLFLLDVLAGAAKRLSSLPREIKTNTKPNPKAVSRTRASAIWSQAVSATNNQNKSAVMEEVVRARIESHTRRFASASKPIFGEPNRFSLVAGFFLFPLMYKYSESSLLYQETIILVHYLHTISIIMELSRNTNIETRMGREVLELTWSLRFHPVAKVRLAVIGCIASVVISVPELKLVDDLYDLLIESRLWLVDVMSNTVTKGDPDYECREFAGYVIYMIESALVKAE